MTEIRLNDIRIFAHHGVTAEEQLLGAWYTVHLSLETEATRAIEHDELSGTVNYAELASVIREEMLVPSRLLEHVAGRIGRRVMSQFTAVRRLSVEVAKEHPPVCVECRSASVRLAFVR